MSGSPRDRYQYERAITAEELRILTLNSSAGSGDPISGELKTVSRRSHPKYTALSYCWGPAGQGTVDIKIGGKTLEIKEELGLALRHLRERSRPLSLELWIDAICIIQDETGPHGCEDKNAQLTSMDRTYTEASAVIVWLGPASEDSTLAMEAISSLGSQLEHCVPDTVPTASLTFPFINGRGPRNYAKAMGRLLDRPWFFRLWVVQEICLAPEDIMIVCGHDTVPFWKLFYLQIHPEMLKLFIASNLAPATERAAKYTKGREAPIGLVRHSFLTERKQVNLRKNVEVDVTISKAQGLEPLMNTDTTKLKEASTTLLRHLWTFRHRKCKEQIDRVYALLGIATDASALSIHVDVSKSAAEVFADATRAIISAHKSLDVLSMCYWPEKDFGRHDPMFSVREKEAT